MKRNSKLYYVIYISILVIYIILVLISFVNLSNFTPVNTSNINDVTIILDAGHGGEDGGATDNDIVEKDINLSITLMLADIFNANGYNVVLTRTTDDFVNAEGDSVRERKVSDMKNRLAIFNSSPNNIVISIHQNKFTQEKYSGTQIFYSSNNTESGLLAESIRSTVISLLQPDNNRSCKESNSDIYLLNNSTVPAVIVECGFISNVEEANKLKTEEYQKHLAFSIFTGFMEYYNN